MNKTALIIQREYLTRVKKKSFIVMTILGPILMAALFIVPAYIATMRTGVKKIQVVDETGLFEHRFESNENLIFLPLSSDIETAKSLFSKSGDDALLYIPKTELSVPTTAFLYFDEQPSIVMKSNISASMRKEVESLKLG
ncbi:MAG TPA: ABC transporter permease, partial [Bacteroidales bacterium]|nr:ABC transporter permease [Bacteroidales bacterium]